MLRRIPAVRRLALSMALAGGVMASPTWASAASTNSVVHHAGGKVAGEVWFNSGFSADHDNNNKPSKFGENSFTIRDKFCGDGWGIGVWWSYKGKQSIHKLTRDCRPGETYEETFQIAPTDQPSVRFEWKAFKWDTNNRSATTYEPLQQDWMGSDKKCNSTWMGRAATYGYEEKGLGYTFEVSMWPTLTARTVGITAKIWDDLQHCVTLPPLSQKELQSVQAQLACHVAYGKPPLNKGGPTWDFEVRRKAISTVEAVLRVDKKCNW
jgi:hypothetical protein